MENILLSSVPIDQLIIAISEKLKQDLQTHFTTIAPGKIETEYKTRKEAAIFLGVSLPTLNEWTKCGTVTGYRIASRVRYKQSDLENALCKIRSVKQGRA